MTQFALVVALAIVPIVSGYAASTKEDHALTYALHDEVAKQEMASRSSRGGSIGKKPALKKLQVKPPLGDHKDGLSKLDVALKMWKEVRVSPSAVSPKPGVNIAEMRVQAVLDRLAGHPVFAHARNVSGSSTSRADRFVHARVAKEVKSQLGSPAKIRRRVLQRGSRHRVTTKAVTTTQNDDMEPPSFSSACQSVPAVTFIDSKCALAPLYYIPTSGGSFPLRKCTKEPNVEADETSEEEYFANTREAIKGEDKDNEIDAETFENMNADAARDRGVDIDARLFKVSPIDALVWAGACEAQYDYQSAIEMYEMAIVKPVKPTDPGCEARCWFVGDISGVPDGTQFTVKDEDLKTITVPSNSYQTQSETEAMKLTTECSIAALKDRKFKEDADVLMVTQNIMNLIVSVVLTVVEIIAEACESAADATPWPFSAGGVACNVMQIAVIIIEVAIEAINFSLDAEQFNLGEMQTHPVNLAEAAQQRADTNTQAVASAASACIEEAYDNLQAEIKAAVAASEKKRRLEMAQEAVVELRSGHDAVIVGVTHALANGVTLDWGYIDLMLNKYTSAMERMTSLTSGPLYTEDLGTAEAILEDTTVLLSEIISTIELVHDQDLGKAMTQGKAGVPVCESGEICSDIKSCQLATVTLPSQMTDYCTAAIPRVELLTEASVSIVEKYDLVISQFAKTLVEEPGSDVRAIFNTEPFTTYLSTVARIQREAARNSGAPHSSNQGGFGSDNVVGISFTASFVEERVRGRGSVPSYGDIGAAGYLIKLTDYTLQFKRRPSMQMSACGFYGWSLGSYAPLLMSGAVFQLKDTYRLGQALACPSQNDCSVDSPCVVLLSQDDYDNDAVTGYDADIDADRFKIYTNDQPGLKKLANETSVVLIEAGCPLSKVKAFWSVFDRLASMDNYYNAAQVIFMNLYSTLWKKSQTMQKQLAIFERTKLGQLTVNDLSCVNVKKSDGSRFLAPASLDAMTRCCSTLTADPGMVPELLRTPHPEMKCLSLMNMYAFERKGKCDATATQISSASSVATVKDCVLQCLTIVPSECSYASYAHSTKSCILYSGGVNSCGTTTSTDAASAYRSYRVLHPETEEMGYIDLNADLRQWQRQYHYHPYSMVNASSTCCSSQAQNPIAQKCVRTGAEANPWWQVYLAGSRSSLGLRRRGDTEVDVVRVYLDANTPKDYLDGFDVYVDKQRCASNWPAPEPGSWTTVPCGARGSVLKITRRTKSANGTVLSFCGIQVYSLNEAYIGDPPTPPSPPTAPPPPPGADCQDSWAPAVMNKPPTNKCEQACWWKGEAQTPCYTKTFCFMPAEEGTWSLASHGMQDCINYPGSDGEPKPCGDYKESILADACKDHNDNNYCTGAEECAAGMRCDYSPDHSYCAY